MFQLLELFGPASSSRPQFIGRRRRIDIEQFVPQNLAPAPLTRREAEQLPTNDVPGHDA